MRRTRVKICGITRPEHARAAVEAGTDAIGLVFYPDSPRAVSLGQAREICREVPALVTVVALFVDAEPQLIESVVEALPVGLLQFHGSESPRQCERYHRPWIKALRMHPDIDLAAEARRYAGASALLLDSYRQGVPGGTGATFDWGRVPAELARRVVLAGGLDRDNVGEAVRRLRPLAVDVSGGVEREKGIKDPVRIAAFVDAVRTADQALASA